MTQPTASPNTDRRMLIGRACFAQLRAPVGDNSVGRAHAVAWMDGAGHVFVRDLDSTNGTRVNGTAIARMTLLKPGDQVTFGSEFTLSHQELADRLGDA